MIEAAELPKNLERGIRMPSMRIPFSGDMKKYDDLGG